MISFPAGTNIRGRARPTAFCPTDGDGVQRLSIWMRRIGCASCPLFLALLVSRLHRPPASFDGLPGSEGTSAQRAGLRRHAKLSLERMALVPSLACTMSQPAYWRIKVTASPRAPLPDLPAAQPNKSPIDACTAPQKPGSSRSAFGSVGTTIALCLASTLLRGSRQERPREVQRLRGPASTMRESAASGHVLGRDLAGVKAPSVGSAPNLEPACEGCRRLYAQ